MQDKSNEEVAEFFNGVTDALGNHALHICAMYGSCMLHLSCFGNQAGSDADTKLFSV